MDPRLNAIDATSEPVCDSVDPGRTAAAAPGFNAERDRALESDLQDRLLSRTASTTPNTSTRREVRAISTTCLRCAAAATSSSSRPRSTWTASFSVQRAADRVPRRPPCRADTRARPAARGRGDGLGRASATRTGPRHRHAALRQDVLRPICQRLPSGDLGDPGAARNRLPFLQGAGPDGPAQAHYRDPGFRAALKDIRGLSGCALVPRGRSRPSPELSDR